MLEVTSVVELLGDRELAKRLWAFKTTPAEDLTWFKI